MKTEKNIFIAFVLNLIFSIFEFFGGVITGSVAILSDSLHDFGDALSIGVSFIFEKVSKKKPNNKYTYGYIGYSVLGGIFTIITLIISSLFVIFSAIKRIIEPVSINYNGMIIFAVIGVVVNFIAVKITHGGHSINQKAVNMHMIEDVLGWIVVFVGSIIIKITGIVVIDLVMSILVALFIIYNSIKNLKPVFNILLAKTPSGLDIDKIKEELLNLSGVVSIHHLHLWTIDGENACLTIHVVVEEYSKSIKENVRAKLKELNILHCTIELETKQDFDEDAECELCEGENVCSCNHRHCHHDHSY